VRSNVVRLGIIKRNFIDISKETIIPLYKSLNRPDLEYCSQIWSPYYILNEYTEDPLTLLVCGN